MGELIDLEALRARRARVASRHPVEACRFHFDLASPFSYLAGERAECIFGSVDWIPAFAPSLEPARSLDRRGLDALQARAEKRAAALRLGLVWPDNWPAAVPRAMRAAAYAGEAGRASAFVLAAGRLAFCGGFWLDDPEVLSEAAAAARLDVDHVLAAADDPVRDAGIRRAGRALLASGAKNLPVLEVGGRRFCGEDRLEAAAAARAAHVTR